MKKIITLLSIVLVTISCSNDDAPAPIAQNYALNGLFNIDVSNATDNQNFLFENGKVFIGNEAGSIHQTLTVGGNLKNDTNAYVFNATTKQLTFSFGTNNYIATFDASTGRLTNGKVTTVNGNSITTLYTFTGQKYIPTESGVNLFKGHWKGTYKSGNSLATTPFNLIVENGAFTLVASFANSLENDIPSFYGLSNSAPVINDKTITGIYTYIGGGTYSFTATYNPATKKLEGTWGSGINVSGGGTVSFEPQNID